MVDLRTLALAAVTTPSVNAPAALSVLSDVLIERGIESARARKPTHKAHKWATSFLMLKGIFEAGEWDVEVTEVRQVLSTTFMCPCILIYFERADRPGETFQYVIRLTETGRLRSPQDAEAPAEPGPWCLRATKVRTRAGRVFIKLNWDPRTTQP